MGDDLAEHDVREHDPPDPRERLLLEWDDEASRMGRGDEA